MTQDCWILGHSIDMEVSWNRATPSYHPFIDGFFHSKPSILVYHHGHVERLLQGNHWQDASRSQADQGVMNDVWYTYGTFMRTYVQSVYIYIYRYIWLYMYISFISVWCFLIIVRIHIYIYTHVRIYKIWLLSIVCLMIIHTCHVVYAYIYIIYN